MKIVSKRNVFCSDENNPSFCEKLGYQIRFCAIKMLTQYMNGTLTIEATSLKRVLSLSVKKVIASPCRPPRPVRPIR